MSPVSRCSRGRAQSRKQVSAILLHRHPAIVIEPRSLFQQRVGINRNMDSLLFPLNFEGRAVLRSFYPSIKWVVHFETFGCGSPCHPMRHTVSYRQSVEPCLGCGCTRDPSGPALPVAGVVRHQNRLAMRRTPIFVHYGHHTGFKGTLILFVVARNTSAAITVSVVIREKRFQYKRSSTVVIDLLH
jgi:hypothetical protein